VLADGNLDLHAGLHVLAKHTDHSTHRRPPRRGRLGDLHLHDLARLRARPATAGNEHVLMDAPVLRDDDIDPAIAQEAPDDARAATLEHLHYRGLETAALIDPAYRDQHAVAVQHTTHGPRRQEEVIASNIRGQEPVPIGMARHPAPHEVHLLRKPELPASGPRQLAVVLHRLQAPGQRVLRLFPGNLQRRGDSVEGHWPPALLQQVEDRATSWKNNGGTAAMRRAARFRGDFR